jgi:hypothetical protein
MAEPGDADAVALTVTARSGAEAVHDSDDLMPGNQRKLSSRDISFDHMKIRTADPTRTDADADLPRAGFRLGHFPRR